MQKSKIVAIPTTMEKYFGKGTMLHPSVAEVEELVKQIPVGKITTIKELASHLAKIQGTHVACPMRTGNAIKKIAERHTLLEPDFKIPFWRVVRNDKKMVKSKNYEQWVSKIEDEGFEINYTTKGDAVVNFTEDVLFSFEY
ncbi:MGMT family protein [Aquimarina litoralis]|uniref:MGMT family protein n=1 Tax=Aquimarina litoralis TaxID=584605 RepID=UPI001C566449|nr:MGMT family protein [Aquimarina litoralis]MBW1294859.1 hypothetical protein [Aquimarina litoralis]